MQFVLRSSGSTVAVERVCYKVSTLFCSTSGTPLRSNSPDEMDEYNSTRDQNRKTNPRLTLCLLLDFKSFNVKKIEVKKSSFISPTADAVVILSIIIFKDKTSEIKNNNIV